MIIAYITTGKIPSREANSVHVMKMCSALSASPSTSAIKNMVTLFVPDYRNKLIDVDNIFNYYDVPENFAIERVTLRFPRITRLQSMRFSFAITRHLKDKQFDIIFCRDIFAACLMTVFHKKTIFFEDHKMYRHNSLEDFAFRLMLKTGRMKKMVVVTDALKQQIISRYQIDPALIYVAPDGADPLPDTITPAKLVTESSDMFQVGYIGHLYKGRGMEILGEAASKCPFAYFHIVGGNEEDVLYWKNLYNNIKNIHFYGHVPPSQTAAYGTCMDVLIAPYQKAVSIAGKKSKENTVQWMSPLKIFEYLALGKPIICSDIPVLREVLTDSVTGILCPPDDANAWIDSITKLYYDKDSAVLLAKNALGLFESYTWLRRAENFTSYVFNS